MTGCTRAPTLVTAPPAPVPAPTVPAAVAQPATLLEEGLAALHKHSGRLLHRDRMALVDFSLHSREPRFHLVDVAGGRIERSWLVAHGSGSDRGHTGMLQQFSNEFGSHATSRGAYLTADCYMGKYGRSQKLVGLDPDNNQALDRAIVVHGAPYVDRSMIRTHGRIGRSQGCFAFELDEVNEVMDILGLGRMIYAGKMV